MISHNQTEVKFLKRHLSILFTGKVKAKKVADWLEEVCNHPDKHNS